MDPRKQSARRGGDALSMVDPAYDLRVLNAIARETAIAPEPNSGERGGGEGNVFIAPVDCLYAMARVYFTLTDATFDSS